MANSQNPMTPKLSSPLQNQLQKLAYEPENRNMLLPSDFNQPILMRTSEHGGIFLTTDDNALARQIEQLHKPDARYVNVRPLFHLVEEIMNHSSPTVENLSRDDREAKRRPTLNGLEEVPELPLIVERISSEMTCKLLSGIDAHNTTLSVLNMLPHFSWEAKVVLTLAAFSLTFGDFWLLVQLYSTNPLAKSMALIKRLPMIMEHPGAVYVTNEDPEVKAAMTHFPIAVYWIVRSAVAAAC